MIKNEEQTLSNFVETNEKNVINNVCRNMIIIIRL